MMDNRTPTSVERRRAPSPRSLSLNSQSLTLHPTKTTSFAPIEHPLDTDSKGDPTSRFSPVRNDANTPFSQHHKYSDQADRCHGLRRLKRGCSPQQRCSSQARGQRRCPSRCLRRECTTTTAVSAEWEREEGSESRQECGTSEHACRMTG